MAGEEQQSEVLGVRIDSEAVSDRNLVNKSVEDLRASLYERRSQLKSLAAITKLVSRARWANRLPSKEFTEQRKELRRLKRGVAWNVKQTRLRSCWQENFKRQVDACLKDSREYRVRKEEEYKHYLLKESELTEKARQHVEELRLLKYKYKILDLLIICTAMIVAIIVVVAWK